MFAAQGQPLFYLLLDGGIPTVGIVIGTAVVHRWNKDKENRKAGSANVAARLGNVEEGIDEIKVGLFGKQTPFGKTEGFVDKVDRTLDRHGKQIGEILKDTKTNGGKSSKDDLIAIRKAVQPHKGQGEWPQMEGGDDEGS